MSGDISSGAARETHLSLIYELLDAHVDTVELAREPDGEVRWAAHLDYLRALHRRAKEILARSEQSAVWSGRSESGGR